MGSANENDFFVIVLWSTWLFRFRQIDNWMGRGLPKHRGTWWVKAVEQRSIPIIVLRFVTSVRWLISRFRDTSSQGFSAFLKWHSLSHPAVHKRHPITSTASTGSEVF